jgi:transposase
MLPTSPGDRATEFLDFLKQIDTAVPERTGRASRDGQLRHPQDAPKIKAWLARRPHWHVHFTPTSASWINQVERWFAELTRKQLQRGVHRSAAELEADIAAFIEAHNEKSKTLQMGQVR